MKNFFIVGLVHFCSSIYAVNAATWTDLGATGDVNVADNIIAAPSSIIQIDANKTINGNNYSLTGASGAYFEVPGDVNFTFKDFGKLSEGTKDNNTFSYTDISGNTIYKTIDESVNTFTSPIFQMNRSNLKDNIVIDNSVFYNNSARVIKHDSRYQEDGENRTFNILNSYFVGNNYAGNIGDGGVFYFDYGVADIANSVFSNNSSNNGGAIAASANTTLTIKDSIFDGNTATDSMGGGAIAMSNPSTLKIENSVFTNNSAAADGDGGAIKAYNPSHIEYIKNSTFKNNIAAYSGGAISSGRITTIENSLFAGNVSNHNGGAIWYGLNDETSDEIIDFYITDSTFTGNSANDHGGAVDIESGTPNHTFYITNTKFIENESKYDIAGALFTSSNVNYKDVEFTENKAPEGYGGALYILGAGGDSASTLVDTLFTNNQSGNDAGAIYSQASNVNIYAHQKDVIFSGNTASGDSADYNAGNDIYFDVGGETYYLRLNASEGRKIVFDGGLTSWFEYAGKAIMNINSADQSYTDIKKQTISVGNTGEIQFNNRIGDAEYGFDINLYSGKLSIGQNSVVNAAIDNPDGLLNNNNNLAITGNAILNTINNATGTISPKTFQIDSGLNWEYQFDVDMENEKADIIVNAENGADSKVDISNFHILNAPTKDEFTIKYSENNINGHLPDDYSIVIGDKTFNLYALNNDEGSHLVVKKAEDIGGLAWAVHTQADKYIIDPSGINNGTVDAWVGTSNTVLKDLAIDGNKQDIVSNTNIDGLIVKEGVKLTLNDVNLVKGFNDSFVNNGTLILTDTSVLNNAGNSAIINNHGDITITANKKDIAIDAGNAVNAVSANGGSIRLNGTKLINIVGNVSGSNDAALIIDTNTDFNGEITSLNTVQNNANVNVNNITAGSYTLNNGILNINGIFSNTDFTINGGNLNIYNNLNAKTFVFNGGRVNSANNKINSISANTLDVKNTTEFIVDVDLQNKLMDTLYADNARYSGGKINVKAFNYLSDSTQSNIKIDFANDAIKNYITTDVKSYMNKIYKYDVSYDKNDGTFNFATPTSAKDADSFNPAALVAPVAAQLGGYLTQLNSYDAAFQNMDMYMLTTNKAVTDSYSGNNYSNSAVWFSPYASFEDVDLKYGPTVSNDAYGFFAGAESKLYKLGRGWDGIINHYVGYNGSRQDYKDNNIYQNGGTIGVSGMAYKDNFFTGLTVNAGANTGKADTMYGDEDFALLMTGVASKSGYNYELFDGKFVVQPNFQIAYTMVNTSDYVNAAGVQINAAPLHAITLTPGAKFIGNLDNGWQPYASVNVIWNIMDKTQFTANDVSLPEMVVKPYVMCGSGLRKAWGEKFVGYAQAFFTDGGTNGLGVKLDFRWRFGE